MPIPDYQALLLPVLRFLEDGEEHSLRETIDSLSGSLRLSEEEKRELLPSGRQPVFDNRVGWARTYLKKAGLLEPTRRGSFRITGSGRSVLASKPARLDVKFLEQFPEFQEFKAIRRPEKQIGDQETEKETRSTPEEALEEAYATLRSSLASDLLTQIKRSPPSLFEQLVIDLLVKMGYGGSRQDAGQVIGKSGDEGIDGIIKEDRLGLDTIYIQAKRWENTVGRPEIQKFAGALQGQRSKKGILLTTANFTREAMEFASRIDTKVILIDGQKLAELLIDFDVGVTTITTYKLKTIDSDYFLIS